MKGAPGAYRMRSNPLLFVQASLGNASRASSPKADATFGLADKLLEVFTDAEVAEFRHDRKQFTEFKRSVQLRYQEIADIKEYEPKPQKLLVDHVVARPAETIIQPVNINDH